MPLRGAVVLDERLVADMERDDPWEKLAIERKPVPAASPRQQRGGFRGNPQRRRIKPLGELQEGATGRQTGR